MVRLSVVQRGLLLSGAGRGARHPYRRGKAMDVPGEAGTLVQVRGEVDPLLEGAQTWRFESRRREKT